MDNLFIESWRPSYVGLLQSQKRLRSTRSISNRDWKKSADLLVRSGAARRSCRRWKATRRDATFRRVAILVRDWRIPAGGETDFRFIVWLSHGSPCVKTAKPPHKRLETGATPKIQWLRTVQFLAQQGFTASSATLAPQWISGNTISLQHFDKLTSTFTSGSVH
jgi:hypothetical protein